MESFDSGWHPLCRFSRSATKVRPQLVDQKQGDVRNRKAIDT
jgi:hypothetical protein